MTGVPCGGWPSAGGGGAGGGLPAAAAASHSSIDGFLVTGEGSATIALTEDVRESWRALWQEKEGRKEERRRPGSESFASKRGEASEEAEAVEAKAETMAEKKKFFGLRKQSKTVKQGQGIQSPARMKTLEILSQCMLSPT